MFMKQKLSAPLRSLAKRCLLGAVERANKQEIESEKGRGVRLVRPAGLVASTKSEERVRWVFDKFKLFSVGAQFARGGIPRCLGNPNTVVKNPGRRFARFSAFDFLASSEVFSTAGGGFYPNRSETVNTCSSFSCVSF